MLIESFEHLQDSLCSTAGYPVLAVCVDGGLLCASCVEAEEGLIRAAMLDTVDDQWEVVALHIHFEGVGIQCDHCGGIVESAYGEIE